MRVLVGFGVEALDGEGQAHRIVRREPYNVKRITGSRTSVERPFTLDQPSSNTFG